MFFEKQRLIENSQRIKHWHRWGPYLAARQWGTVREDYSPNGDCWRYFPHDHARSRAYRWGEDGLLGFSDNKCRLCFSLALWNGKDSILKERLFGLTNPEGNHGEDVKEQYFYLFSTPTYSYVKSLYKYPQAAFPYDFLVAENEKRSPADLEFELEDTKVFDENRYFDIFVEYAKQSPNHVLIRLTAINRGPEPAVLDLIPQILYRNVWTWSNSHESCQSKPRIHRNTSNSLALDQESLGRFYLAWEALPAFKEALFTENETNEMRLVGAKANRSQWVKDAFHEYIINGKKEAVCPDHEGTKAGLHHQFVLAPGGSCSLRLRLYAEGESNDVTFETFDATMEARASEGQDFYKAILPPSVDSEGERIAVQAYAGLLLSKQFYHYVVQDWLEGDPAISIPPPERYQVRNKNWKHLYSRDIISMPDKWEYPWFAAWDLAFHMLPMAKVDPEFAKNQLVLMLREWYMHPNGQMPAYEFMFDDVNPPVHAWAARRVYEFGLERGERDRGFLTSTFQKLLLNFTWWVNRKDTEGHGIFSGGFLGLDNISIFDRSSKSVPLGGSLQQADGTAWMGFFCSNMLQMALELSRDGDRLAVAYEDMASKFFEHFIQIVDAMNSHGGTGLWDDHDGFYYDQILLNHNVIPIKVRSLVGLLPLIAVSIITEETLEKLPGFARRFHWFLNNKPYLAHHIVPSRAGEKTCWLISAVPHERLQRVLHYLFDPNEFLSPFGIRSLSKYHDEHPFTLETEKEHYTVRYTPGESTTRSFGGNSNWRGPVWFPANHLLIEALQTYHRFYGPALQVQDFDDTTKRITLAQAADEVASRLTSLFRSDSAGRVPSHGINHRFAEDPHWKDLLLFYEYFHADTGRGLGASHQTGWTALVTLYIESLAPQEPTTHT